MAQIKISLPDDEAAELRRRAEAEGLQVSAFVRMLVFGEVEPVSFETRMQRVERTFDQLASDNPKLSEIWNA